MDVDKTKMDKLINLLEELVINKVRIEKMQNEISDSRHKKILVSEIQNVSKVQEIIKDIQTTTMGPIYTELKNYLNSNSNCVEFYGENSKLDNFNEEQLCVIIKIIIEYLINSKKCDSEKKVKVTSSNDSTNLIILIGSSKNIINKKKLVQRFNKDFIPFTYLSEEEVDDWIEEADLSDSINTFRKVYKTAKLLNAFIEIRGQNNVNDEILITIPISSSIINAQLIVIDNQTYAIPMDYIEKVMSMKSVEEKVSCNKQFIMYMNSAIPVIPIYDELDLGNSNEATGYVVLRYNNKMKALPVDSLLDQADVVMRPKPMVINEIKEFKGTTILGDGNVTIVLDIPYIVGNAS